MSEGLLRFKCDICNEQVKHDRNMNSHKDVIPRMAEDLEKLFSWWTVALALLRLLPIGAKGRFGMPEFDGF